MSTERKTATELGFKIGDQFVIENYGNAGTTPDNTGRVVTLTEDDDTLCPYFQAKDNNETFCLHFNGLKPLPSMEHLRVGDIITYVDGVESRVFAAQGELVALSEDDNFKKYDNWYAIPKLIEMGWKVKSDEEVKELTVADVEKLVGSKVKIVK